MGYVVRDLRQTGASQISPYSGQGKIWGRVEQSALCNLLINVSAGPRVPETYLIGTSKLARWHPATADRIGRTSGKIQTRERLGGPLNLYHREAVRSA